MGESLAGSAKGPPGRRRTKDSAPSCRRAPPPSLSALSPLCNARAALPVCGPHVRARNRFTPPPRGGGEGSSREGGRGRLGRASAR